MRLNPILDVHCIGHSLGSHVCGFCGKVNQLNRISGKYNIIKDIEIVQECNFQMSKALDPAAPYFTRQNFIIKNDRNCLNRLCKSDATYVNFFITKFLMS